MSDRASELRAIADGRLMLNVRNGVTVARSMLARIADEFETMSTALAAKNAELAAVRADRDEWKVWAKQHHSDLRRAEAQLAEARKALEQIERKICAAEHGHTINDVLANYREVRRTVQDARAARRALEAQGGE